MLHFIAALALASTQAAQPAAPAAAAGAIVISLESKTLSETRQVWINAPPACTAAAPCDTLYVLDAHALFPVASAYATVMQSMGRLRPVIVVGIPSTSPDDRIRNFTASASETERARYPRAGGSARFAAFFEQDVIPAIAARFPATSTRVIAGHSLAGLFALETLTRNEVSMAIAISPTLGWHDGAAARKIGEWVKSSPGPRRLYVSVSDGDTEPYRQHFDRLEQLLTGAGPSWLRSTFVRRAGEDHVTTFAPALQQAMLAFFPR